MNYKYFEQVQQISPIYPHHNINDISEALYAQGKYISFSSSSIRSGLNLFDWCLENQRWVTNSLFDTLGYAIDMFDSKFSFNQPSK